MEVLLAGHLAVVAINIDGICYNTMVTPHPSSGRGEWGLPCLWRERGPPSNPGSRECQHGSGPSIQHTTQLDGLQPQCPRPSSAASHTRVRYINTSELTTGWWRTFCSRWGADSNFTSRREDYCVARKLSRCSMRVSCLFFRNICFLSHLLTVCNHVWWWCTTFKCDLRRRIAQELMYISSSSSSDCVVCVDAVWMEVLTMRISDWAVLSTLIRWYGALYAILRWGIVCVWKVVATRYEPSWEVVSSLKRNLSRAMTCLILREWTCNFLTAKETRRYQSERWINNVLWRRLCFILGKSP